MEIRIPHPVGELFGLVVLSDPRDLEKNELDKIARFGALGSTVLLAFIAAHWYVQTAYGGVEVSPALGNVIFGAGFVLGVVILLLAGLTVTAGLKIAYEMWGDK